MWLIEFVDGHLNGATFPIESSLILTGSTDSPDVDVITIPEYLSTDDRLEFTIDEIGPKLIGAKKSNIPLKLTQNKIYSIKGVNFFIFQEGERSPRYQQLRLKQYYPTIIITLILNILVSVFILFTYSLDQDAHVGNYFRYLKSAYINDGKLYVYDKDTLSKIPESWRKNSVFITSGHYQKVSQMNIEVISSETGNRLNNKVISKDGYDLIQIETHVKDYNIMVLFGGNNIAFKKVDDNWLVSEPDKAIKLLKKNGLSSYINKIKSLTDKSAIIDKSDFPYSIFYSSTTSSYIYDENSRYWKGSLVPGLGVIQSITSKKIIFKDDNKLREYLIKQE